MLLSVVVVFKTVARMILGNVDWFLFENVVLMSIVDVLFDLLNFIFTSRILPHQIVIWCCGMLLRELWYVKGKKDVLLWTCMFQDWRGKVVSCLRVVSIRPLWIWLDAVSILKLRYFKPYTPSLCIKNFLFLFKPAALCVLRLVRKDW